MELWRYRTNVGPTKAMIVDQEGDTVLVIPNYCKSGKEFEALVAGICRDHNEAGTLRAQRDDLAAALLQIKQSWFWVDQEHAHEQVVEIARAALAKLKEGE